MDAHKMCDSLKYFGTGRQGPLTDLILMQYDAIVRLAPEQRQLLLLTQVPFLEQSDDRPTEVTQCNRVC